MRPETHAWVEDADPDGRWAIAGTLTDESITALYTKTVEFAQWLQQELTSSPPCGATPKS